MIQHDRSDIISHTACYFQQQKSEVDDDFRLPDFTVQPEIKHSRAYLAVRRRVWGF